MRDYGELVERLKESDDNCHAECYECPGECLSSGCNIFSEAADAIEELVGQRDGLLASVLELMHREDLCKWFKCHNSDTQKEAEK